MTIIEKLRQNQGDRSKAEYARHLGLAQPLVGYLYDGTRQPGVKVLSALAGKGYIDRDDVWRYLLARYDERQE